MNARAAQAEMDALMKSAEKRPTPAQFARAAELVRLAAVDGDDEVAHVMEDKMRETALKAILNFPEQHREIAAAALSTSALVFSRWCA